MSGSLLAMSGSRCALPGSRLALPTARRTLSGSTLALLGAALACAAAACGPGAGALGREQARRLEPQETLESELDLARTHRADFELEVPPRCVLVRLELACRPVELELSARQGRARSGDDDSPDYRVATETGHAVLAIDRFGEPPIAPGIWTFGVEWTHDAAPRTADRRVDRIPFTLTARCFPARVDGQLVEEGRASALEPESGGFRTFVIDVPEDARVLRLDLAEVDADLDLYARRGEPLIALDDDTHFARHFYGRETLVIGRDDDPPLAPGPWYVDVVAPSDPDRREPFRIFARFSADPPAELVGLPALAPAIGAGPLGRALAAVVEVTVDDGVGSGTLLTPDGLVLTNAHVVAQIGGEPAEDIVVAITLDPRLPPRESFRAELVAIDDERDLALLRITSGFYGEPLPADYRFPTVELAEPGLQAIGDALWLVGYPSTGGQGSRVSISATRGILSGFEHTEQGDVIKTDAEINSGNSGGAAVDARGRLVGVPTSMVEVGSGHIGYVHPWSWCPPDWQASFGLGRTAKR